MLLQPAAAHSSAATTRDTCRPSTVISPAQPYRPSLNDAYGTCQPADHPPPPRPSRPLAATTSPYVWPSNPHRPGARGTALPTLPRFPPLEVFVRRPPARAAKLVKGRHPKTFTISEVGSLITPVDRPTKGIGDLRYLLPRRIPARSRPSSKPNAVPKVCQLA
jgi:hypothetical protein